MHAGSTVSSYIVWEVDNCIFEEVVFVELLDGFIANEVLLFPYSGRLLLPLYLMLLYSDFFKHINANWLLSVNSTIKYWLNILRFFMFDEVLSENWMQFLLRCMMLLFNMGFCFVDTSRNGRLLLRLYLMLFLSQSVVTIWE